MPLGQPLHSQPAQGAWAWGKAYKTCPQDWGAYSGWGTDRPIPIAVIRTIAVILGPIHFGALPFIAFGRPKVRWRWEAGVPFAHKVGVGLDDPI